MGKAIYVQCVTHTHCCDMRNSYFSCVVTATKTLFFITRIVFHNSSCILLCAFHIRAYVYYKTKQSINHVHVYTSVLNHI